MIDLHCHLLPAVDDGPADLGAALRLAAAQAAAGIRTVAVTPHVNSAFPNDARLIARSVAEMRVAIGAAGIPLELASGAEIDIESALELNDEQLGRLALGGGPWLLLEAPLAPGLLVEPLITSVRARGYEVLLAHPERSPVLQRDPGIVARLVRNGLRTQLTTGGLDGHFGRTVQRFALQLVDDGLVHTLASDAHDTVRRPPGLRGPLEASGLGDYAQVLCEEHPAAVLAGESLPQAVVMRRRRRSLLGRLRR